jgi:hypothetical protein
MTHPCRDLRLAGPHAFSEAVDAVDVFLRDAVADGVSLVLLDLRGLTGVGVPDLAARAWMLRRWAATSQGRVRIAIVAPPELIDPDRFGVVLARGFGMDGNVFEVEDDARDWLAKAPPL